MADETLFIATPLHDGKVSHLYMAGALRAMVAFADRVRFDVQLGSFLPRNRDILTARFIESGCSHMLCIDSDLQWTPEHVQALLDTGKPFVSGIYCKKQPDRKLPMKLNGKRDGDLYGCDYVPGGFILLARHVVVAMSDHYRALAYQTPHGRVVALWAPLFERGFSYASEDVSFCRRWTRMGGDIWAHPGVVLGHVGELTYLPDMADGKAVIDGMCD
jgi:hypothetical protein